MLPARLACIVFFVGGCLCLLFTGCATTSGIEATGKVVGSDPKAGLNKSIVINNRGLASDIEIIDMRSAFAGDMLKVQVALRSNNRDTIPVQYKFDWLDANGFEINSNQAWKPFMVYGKETRTIQGVAPDPRAREFKLKLRDPDSVDND
jgi:uncharacterized protein YcfL